MQDTTTPRFAAVADLAKLAERATQSEARGRAALAAAPTVEQVATGAKTGPDIFFPVEKTALALLRPSGPAFNPLGLERHAATVREIDGRPVVLGIVGQDYEVVPMADVVAQAEAGIRAALGDAMFSRAKVRDLMSHHGARVYREYTVPTGAEIPHAPEARVKGTTVAFRLVVGNSYDTSSTVNCSSGTLDLLCTNGMVGFVAGRRTAIRHSRVAFCFPWEQRVRDAFGDYRLEVEAARRWAMVYLTERQARERLERLGLGPMVLERHVAQFRREAEQRGSTLWALASALTFDATHANSRTTGADHHATSVLARQAEVGGQLRLITA